MLLISLQACSQDFSWRGGGAYLNNQDQIINIWMIRYANSEDTQDRVSNLRSKWNGGRLLMVR